MAVSSVSGLVSSLSSLSRTVSSLSWVARTVASVAMMVPSVAVSDQRQSQEVTSVAVNIDIHVRAIDNETKW